MSGAMWRIKSSKTAGAALPAILELMKTGRVLTVPDPGPELAQLGPDDPETDPVSFTDKIVSEESLLPAGVLLHIDRRYMCCMT